MRRFPRVRRFLVVAVLGGSMGGCTPRDPFVPNDLPDVEGTWTYTAWGIAPRANDAVGNCSIDGMSFEIGPWRWDGFTGRSSESVLTCTGGLEPLTGPLPSYPLRRGGAVGPYISFDLGSSAWRHEGEFVDGMIEGTFMMTGAQMELTGHFRATRRK